MLVTARTLHHPDNGSHTMLLSIEDTTDRRDREVAKDMLFGELRHRMKNLLAVAQSIARQTTTEGRSAEEYRDAFLGRFGALVQAQDLAFAEQDETALGAAVERILAPYAPNPEAVVIDHLRLKWVESGGPPVAPPATTGYGSKLIQSATTYSLGGWFGERNSHSAGGCLSPKLKVAHAEERLDCRGRISDRARPAANA